MFRPNVDLYEKYRPRTLQDLVGREDVVNYLMARIPEPGYNRDALMFVGASGTGKTTAARIVGTILAGHQSDYREFPGAKIGTIEQVRSDLDEWMHYLPMGGRWRVLVIDEAQAMSPAAKEAFLELVENARPMSMIIFTATKKNNRIPFSSALISRFKVFNFDAFDAHAIKIMLDRITGSEGWPTLSHDAFAAIFEGSEGNMRKAVQLLETFQYTGEVLGQKIQKAAPPTRSADPGAIVKMVAKAFADYESLFKSRGRFIPLPERTDSLRRIGDAFLAFKNIMATGGNPVQLVNLLSTIGYINTGMRR